MFTGRYPHETGVQNNSGAVDVEKFPILGKVFKDAGYDTGYTGKVHIYLDYEDRKKAKFSEKTADIHGFDFLFQGKVNAADSSRKGDWGRVYPGIEFLKEKMDALKIECHVTYANRPIGGYADQYDFLIQKLTSR